MDSRRFFRALIVAGAATATLVGCDRNDVNYVPIQISTEPLVFGDDYEGVIFQPFLGTKLDAVRVVRGETYDDSDAAIRIDVPAAASPEGGFAGGAFTAFVARDLRGYDALRFYAKSNAPANEVTTLNFVGIGNDNTGTSRFEAGIGPVRLGRGWTEVIVPIPDPSRLEAERGMLAFAEGFEDSSRSGYSVWIDEVEWVRMRGIERTGAFINSGSLELFLGSVVAPSGGRVDFDVDGRTVTVDAAAGYFDYESDADSVVSDDDGVLRVVGSGEARIRASIDGEPAGGVLVVSSLPSPTESAPNPTRPAAKVLSLFSDAYAIGATVDNWSVDFGQPQVPTVTDLRIGGNDVKAFTGVTFGNFLAIDFASQPIDAEGFEFLSVDVWLPELPAGAQPAGIPLLTLKLVDFGPDGVFTPFDDAERDDRQSTIGRGENVPEGDLVPTGEWITLVFALDDFENVDATLGPEFLNTRSSVAQFIIETNAGALFLDNVLFFNE